MATQVLIAHTGQRLEVDASQFSAYVFPLTSGAAPVRLAFLAASD